MVPNSLYRFDDINLHSQVNLRNSTCVEALAAALAIIGLQEDGDRLLSHFGWGEGFWVLNEPYIKAYRACSSAEDVENAQSKILDDLESSWNERRRLKDADGEEDLLVANPNHATWNLPPDSDSELETDSDKDPNLEVRPRGED
ncbi:hypothetical protein DL96DRAFT_1051417 [Flagelloscypha sp. PMI_526]|nr:hypothetical protein DL96DRAFT_1051417 [Flagelloscypha sp. PMI_526]